MMGNVVAWLRGTADAERDRIAELEAEVATAARAITSASNRIAELEADLYDTHQAYLREAADLKARIAELEAGLQQAEEYRLKGVVRLAENVLRIAELEAALDDVHEVTDE